MENAATPVFTVGHSTRPPGALEALLRGHGVEVLVDVRALPRSRRMPHFSSEALARSTPAAGIEYVHLPELGGRRRPLADSVNGAWRNESFRGYADHMASEEFLAGLGRLEGLANDRRAAVMCAEALWWRCHRRLVADALVARGHAVEHLGPGGGLTPHALTPFAVVGPDGALTYPRQPALG